jgi:hypothetical protein
MSIDIAPQADESVIAAIPVQTRIISILLHQIDIPSNKLRHIPLAIGNTDLDQYLSDLLREINDKEQKRAYEFLTQTTEFYTCLTSSFQAKDLTKNQHSQNLAARLLHKEVVTDRKYGHLGSLGAGHVKKGSFLQFLYKERNTICYLGVKIEHQGFIDEEDFKKKAGLTLNHKIYKACKASYLADGIPSEIFVYDTNSAPASYWWNDFLELKQVRDDAYNTRLASTEVLKVVNGLKSKSLSDYTILRNSVISAFKQNATMKYDDFVENIFGRYEAVETSASDELPKIIKKLKELPAKKNFDSNFNLIPSEVPFKRSKYVLTKEISLSIEEGIQNINDKIWAEKSASGKYLVVIDSPEGYKRFMKKERE